LKTELTAMPLNPYPLDWPARAQVVLPRKTAGK
jgi:hypothetical protein